jgi:hypothetical protein
MSGIERLINIGVDPQLVQDYIDFRWPYKSLRKYFDVEYTVDKGLRILVYDRTKLSDIRAALDLFDLPKDIFHITRKQTINLQ